MESGSLPGRMDGAMRRIIFLLILSVCVNVSAQNWKRGLAVAGYHIGTVALGAVADGLYDEGHKEWGHALHAAEVGALVGGPFIFKVKRNEALSYLLSYGFIRVGTFDSFYNLTRDLPLLYNGTTSTYDNIMNTIPPHGKVWYKSFSIIIGFTIPIKEL
jgi:hypothetical protein